MAAHREPTYELTLGGRVITPRFHGRLTRLRLTDHRGLQSDQLDLTLSDDDGQLALPSRGVELGLALGWTDTGTVDRGTYVVDEIEHSGAPDMVHIRARSANMRSPLPHKRSKSWHAVTLADVIARIATDYDIAPSVSSTLAGIEIQHIDQTDESDLNFLTRLAQRFDAIATVKADHLLFIAAGDSLSANGVAIPAVTITRADGDGHRYSVTDRDSYTGVAAQWHDYAQALTQTVVVGSSEDPKQLRPTYATAADAQHAARAEWQRIQRGQATFAFTLAEGRADLYPETPINVRGFKPEIDATAWLLTEVTHNFSASAYTTSLQMQKRNSAKTG